MTLTATATDDVGVVKVEFYAGTHLLGTLKPAAAKAGAAIQANRETQSQRWMEVVWGRTALASVVDIPSDVTDAIARRTIAARDREERPSPSADTGQV